MTQQVGGNASQMKVPTAANARNILQNVESLYNLELVNRVFEDASIAASKVVGGVGGVFNYTGANSLYGDNNLAAGIGAASIQIGGAVATGHTSIAIGAVTAYKAVASSPYSTAIGGYARATGSSAVALGYNSQAMASKAVAVGSGAEARDVNSIAIGDSNAITNDSIVIGNGSATTGQYSIAIGKGVSTTQSGAFAIGRHFANTVPDSFAIGVGNSAKLIFDTWTASAGVKTGTHFLPFKIGAATYNILISNV